MNTNQREKRAFGKILSSMILALVLVIGCLPMNLYTEKAAAKAKDPDAAVTIKLGNAKYYQDGCFGYEKAKVSAKVPLYTLEISVDKGKIFKDTKTWGDLPEWSASDLYLRSVTWQFKTPASEELVQDIIQNLKFGQQNNENINSMTVTIRVDGNYSHLPKSGYSIKAYTNPDDNQIHYYMFVNKSGLDWTEAYKEAKSWTYMGLKGYLATLTSAKEDAYLDGITLEEAWAGGARITDDAATRTLLDQDEADFLEVQPDIETSAWVWTCGPEAGQYIHLDDTASDGSKPIPDAQLVTTYSHWKSGEPNNWSSDEWCLEVHHSSEHLWNDYCNEQSVRGYFVEFSDYEGGHTLVDDQNNPITYNASATVADTFTITHHYTKFSTDCNTIITACDDGCKFEPRLALAVNDGESVSSSNPVSLNPNGLWSAFVGSEIYSASSTLYKGVDNDYSGTVKPTKAGNYKAYETVTINGQTYDLYAEFSLDNKGIIHDEASHVHRWKTTVENGVVYIQCVSNYGGRNSDCNGKVFKVQTDIDTEADPSIDSEYINEPKVVAINDGGDVDENLDLPKVTYKYIEVDENGVTKRECGTTPPKTEGTYRQIILIDGEEVGGYTEYTITRDEESGELGINKTYRYEYSGVGIDRSKGYIIYAVSQKEGAVAGNSPYEFVRFVSDKEAGYDADHKDLRNYGFNTDGTSVDNVYIDMYNQVLKTPDGYTVAAYKTKGNSSWTVIGEGKTFEDNYLSKIFSSGADKLTITNGYDSQTKKSTGTEYFFSKITKPSSVEGMRACYDVCADETGVTNGQFVFMTTSKNKRVLYNIGNTYEISFADPTDNTKNNEETKKINWTNPWGLWPSTGGVWVPNALIGENGNAKHGKYTFYLRTKASVLNNSNGTMIYTAASKEKKITVATVQKAPKLTVTYGKKLNNEAERDYITVKKGSSVFFGTTIPDPLNEEYIMDVVTDGAIEADKFTGKTVTASEKAIKRDITDYIATGSRSILLAWTNATATKPASLKQEIKLYERKKIVAGTAFTPDAGGKVKLETEGGIKYEIKDGNKWKTSIKMPSEATTKAFEIRLKNTAKSGKESLEGSDAMTTIGVSSILEVEFIKDGKKVKVQSAVVKDMPKDED